MDGYTRVKKIGTGSFGTAILVKEKSTKNQYVLKKIPCADMDEANQALQEVKVLIQFQHDRIVAYKDFFLDSNSDGCLVVCLIMEFCDGGDLFDMIVEKQKVNARLDVDAHMIWFMDVCASIAYMHMNQVLHRDIKPENVFINSDGRAKIGDFGLARVMEGRSQAKTQCGTPDYMAPEVLQGMSYDEKSDVFSIGAVLYAMVTARIRKMLAMKLTKGDPLELPEDIQPEMEELVRTCLDLDPVNRPTVFDILAMPWLQRWNKNAPIGGPTLGGTPSSSLNPSPREPERKDRSPPKSRKSRKASDNRSKRPSVEIEESEPDMEEESEEEDNAPAPGPGRSSTVNLDSKLTRQFTQEMGAALAEASEAQQKQKKGLIGKMMGGFGNKQKRGSSAKKEPEANDNLSPDELELKKLEQERAALVEKIAESEKEMQWARQASVVGGAVQAATKPYEQSRAKQKELDVSIINLKRKIKGLPPIDNSMNSSLKLEPKIEEEPEEPKEKSKPEEPKEKSKDKKKKKDKGASDLKPLKLEKKTLGSEVKAFEKEWKASHEGQKMSRKDYKPIQETYDRFKEVKRLIEELESED